MWSSVDAVLTRLERADQVCDTLRPLKTPQLSALRKFDLHALVNHYRRQAIRVDLFAHEEIVDAIQDAVSTSSGAASPSAELLARWQQSRGRVQRDFAMVAAMARQHCFTRSLLYARRLCEVLEVCSSWTSLRTADAETAGVLVGELGISQAIGQA